MKMTDLIAKLSPARTQATILESLGDLAIRGFAGLTMALVHGTGKLPPPEQMVQGLGTMGFPAPEVFAWLAALAEFAGGLCLALGILTRPAAFFMGFTMSVAAFVAHAADPFQKKEMALLYLAISLYVFLSGPARFSVDAALQRR